MAQVPGKNKSASQRHDSIVKNVKVGNIDSASRQVCDSKSQRDRGVAWNCQPRTTFTGLDDEILNGRIFDWCIMDEASQSTDPAMWIPLQYCSLIQLGIPMSSF